MYEDEEIEYAETEAEAKENPIEDDEQSERKLLKRELRAQVLKRIEDSARTVTDFKNVTAWWDRLDANRERRERYHETLRSNDDISLEYGASADARCFPSALNNMLEKQNRKGDFLDAIFCCPYEINELVTEEYISDILFLYAVRQYSSAKIAVIKEQSDRNIRKVRGTMLKRIRKKLITALNEKIQQGTLTLIEKRFLEDNGLKIVI